MIYYNIVCIEDKVGTVLDILKTVDNSVNVYIDSDYIVSSIRSICKDVNVIEFDDIFKLDLLGVCGENDVIVISTASNTIFTEDSCNKPNERDFMFVCS